MKKTQLKLSKKAIKNLKLKLRTISDRKAAPSIALLNPTNTSSC